MTIEDRTISFVDLKAQRVRLEPALSQAIAAIVASGTYIGGPKVRELEEKLRDFCGARHCVTCANGTDAMMLVLKAWEIGAGDAVFVPAFTFAATAAVVANAGAIPVFVDVLDDTFNLDPQSLAAAVAWSRDHGLKPKAVIAVDLFGQPAGYAGIEAVTGAEGLQILCDAAQSFGATLNGRSVGSMGDATTTSFYPAKPLGCYGDGGAIFTDDEDLAVRLRSMREHGQGSHRYEHVRIGVNSRLDAIQAVVLLEKLRIFDDELQLRQIVAERYSAGFGHLFAVPRLAEGATSSWAQYTLRTEHRDRIAAACRQKSIPTAIHYPIALSRQPAYRGFPSAPAGVPVAERLAETVISLPMHPYLEPAVQDLVIDTVVSAVPHRRGLAAAR